jgi:hypothetical protein
VAAIALMAFVPPAAEAATCNYTAAMPGSWQNPLNWDCPGGPTATDDVVLGSGDSVTLSADAAAASLSVNGATLGFGTSKLDVSGAPCSARGR